MFLIPLLSAAGFAAAILFLRCGLRRINTQPLSADNVAPLTFSVIIAARNEERNIAGCLQSVFAQDISISRYEVTVIDDRSEDSTPDILQEHLHHHQNLRIITVAETPPGASPKKHAVTQGINAASNEIIVFTDADCRVPPKWLSTINKYFDGDTALVQGITSYGYTPGMNKLFYGLQSVDFISHGIISAAAIGANLPINSNANNMAFRKTVFEEIGGYGGDIRVVSADDDSLLQKIWRANQSEQSAGHRRKIRFMADAGGSVETAPTETLAGVFEQRKRWGSNTVHYRARQIILLATVFIFYVTIVLTAAASFINTSYIPVCASLLLIKLAGEFALMIPGTRIFGKKDLRGYIPLASLIQLPVVLAAVILGTFGRFEWKGRKMARTMR